MSVVQAYGTETCLPGYVVPTGSPPVTVLEGVAVVLADALADSVADALAVALADVLAEALAEALAEELEPSPAVTVIVAATGTVSVGTHWVSVE
jgi:hypothetical protein